MSVIQFESNFLTESFKKLTFRKNEPPETEQRTKMSQKSSSDDDGYEIEIVTNKDRNDIINLARKFFNQDEPLNEYIGLTGPDGKCPDLEEYLIKTLDEGTSVKAISNGKLVAFSMNGIEYRNNIEEKSCVNDPKFQLIIDFLHYNTVKCDIFKRYPNIDKAMSVKIISVDPCMRGKGVATKLVDKTRELAKENGCKMMYVECSSYYSACIMKRLGFKKIYSLNYSDYKVDGKIVFAPKHPHTEFSIYVQEL